MRTSKAFQFKPQNPSIVRRRALIDRNYFCFVAIALGATFESQSEKYAVSVNTITNSFMKIIRLMRWVGCGKEIETLLAGTASYPTANFVRRHSQVFCKAAAAVRVRMITALGGQSKNDLTPEDFYYLYEADSHPFSDDYCLTVHQIKNFKHLAGALLTMPILLTHRHPRRITVKEGVKNEDKSSTTTTIPVRHI